jgi:hypothetical protein
MPLGIKCEENIAVSRLLGGADVINNVKMKVEFNKLELPNDHYLNKARDLQHEYLSELIDVLTLLQKKLQPKEFKTIWNEKLQLRKQDFREKEFIQGACEIVVANYFSTKENFKIEAKVNPNNNKNVDCQFTSKGFTYNIEVKCASFDAKEDVEKSDSFQFQTLGRLDNKDEIFVGLSKALNEGLKNQGKPSKRLIELKNMDNNLKDFLESANQKFNPNCPENEINILLVGCNDAADIQSWIGYLFATEGLFTNDSYVDATKYQNVDLVIFTNLYYKHKDFFEKQIEIFWDLSHSFNLYFENPFRVQEKRKGVDNFYYELTNYNLEFNQFQVPGQAPLEVKEAVKTPHFVIDYLQRKRNIYLFEKKK